MWSTRSTNCITVNGQWQKKHTAGAQGRITAFETTPAIDVVVGEAGDSYDPALERFTRAIIFVKPDIVIVYDRLKTKEPSTFEYWLHATSKFDIRTPAHTYVTDGDVTCDITFLTPMPSRMAFDQTHEYDPNPRPRITLREWHLTAKTTEKQKEMEFLVIYRPHQADRNPAGPIELSKAPAGYFLTIGQADGKLTALLPTNDEALLSRQRMETQGRIKLKLERPGQSTQVLEVGDLH